MKFVKRYDGNYSNNDLPFDNVYIDLNSILHPCCFPIGMTIKTEDEMLVRVFKYLDLMLDQLNPRKLFYIAIDGVAPRAKLNQQRARRYDTSYEKTTKEILYGEFYEQLMKTVREQNIDESKFKFNMDNTLDRNIITPGTEFMEKVSVAVHSYAMYKLNTDPSLKDLKIIVDDSSVPGEGEHKIVSYIRRLRQDVFYDPLTTHAIHGNDGDLLLLALVMHDPFIWILKEKSDKILSPKLDIVSMANIRRKLLHYFREKDKNKQWDYSRTIEDFVLICSFCGNDFVPCLPGISVLGNVGEKSGLSLLLDLYTQYLRDYENSGNDYYLTNQANIQLNNILNYLKIAGPSCVEVLNSKIERGNMSFDLNQYHQQQLANNPIQVVPKQFSSEILFVNKSNKSRRVAIHQWKQNIERVAKSKVKTSISRVVLSDSLQVSTEPGRSTYYMIKHNVSSEMVAQLHQSLVSHYLQALDWIWSYYKSELKSWTWYYPYHYAPLPVDFEDLELILQGFSLGAPLKPLTQLMCTLPRTSLKIVPDIMRGIASELPDMFPDTILKDSDHKNETWRAIPALPFIDVDKMTSSCAAVFEQLAPEDKRRNSFGHTVLYFHSDDQHLIKHFQQLDTDAIHEHSFRVLLKGTSYFRDDDPCQFAGYLFSMCHNSHSLGQQLPSLGQPLDFSTRSPYFQQRLNGNVVVSSIFYGPVSDIKHWNILPAQMNHLERIFQQQVVRADKMRGSNKRTRPADTDDSSDKRTKSTILERLIKRSRMEYYE
jgi:5'-3' exoribonuclease 2